jgi:hypothetical protein
MPPFATAAGRPSEHAPDLFIMGLGMGGTMMPIMTSALKTLRAAEVACHLSAPRRQVYHPAT